MTSDTLDDCSATVCAGPQNTLADDAARSMDRMCQVGVDQRKNRIQPTFVCVPAEIRIQIYDLVVPTYVSISQTTHGYTIDPPGSMDTVSRLRSVCKVVYDELRPRCPLIRFHGYDYDSNLPLGLPSWSLQGIQSIDTPLRIGRALDILNQLPAEGFPRLKWIQFYYNGSPPFFELDLKEFEGVKGALAAGSVEWRPVDFGLRLCTFPHGHPRECNLQAKIQGQLRTRGLRLVYPCVFRTPWQTRSRFHNWASTPSSYFAYSVSGRLVYVEAPFELLT